MRVSAIDSSSLLNMEYEHVFSVWEIHLSLSVENYSAQLNHQEHCTLERMNGILTTGTLLTPPLTNVESDRYMTKNLHSVIAVSKIVQNLDICLPMTCNSPCLRLKIHFR